MRLAQKLILYALIVALVPLAATGFTSIYLGERALRRRIAEHQVAAAVAVASHVARRIEDVGRRTASLLATFDTSDASAEELQGLARLVFRQDPSIRIVAITDAGGDALVPPTRLERPVGGELADHPLADEASVKALLDVVRRGDFTDLSAGSVAVGRAYARSSVGALVPLIVRSSATATGPTARYVVVELLLPPDLLDVDGIVTGASSRRFLVDEAGRALIHPEAEAGAPLVRNGAVALFLRDRRRAAVRYEGEGGAYLAAFAPVGDLGWAVVVEQPERTAFATATQMRHQTLGWLFGTLVIVLATGILVADRFRRTLRALMDGVAAFSAGRLEHRIAVRGNDELAELGRTLNAMAEALERSNSELRRWNRTLEERVRERTEALRSAQVQVLTQAKLAALGQLGAGVAHEINNPLSSVLGYAELLMERFDEGDPTRRDLERIREGARRCKQVTMQLLRFSERRLRGPGPYEIGELVREVLDLMEPGLREAGITVEREIDEDLPSLHGDASQVAQVVVNLVTNARNAMAKGGRLTVRLGGEGDAVVMRITDTGKGIPPEDIERIFDPFFTTKDEWRGVGLGLSVAYRIVTDHGGTIHVTSRVGQGSTFEVRLPVGAWRGSEAPAG